MIFHSSFKISELTYEEGERLIFDRISTSASNLICLTCRIYLLRFFTSIILILLIFLYLETFAVVCHHDVAVLMKKTLTMKIRISLQVQPDVIKK